MVKLLGLLALLSIFTTNALSQSTHAATTPASLWVGADAATFNPDWGCKSSSPFSCASNQLIGPGVFVNADRLVGRFGIDGEARWLRFHSQLSNLKESTYLIGPRVHAFSYKRLSFDLNLLVGVGSITVPLGSGDGTYFVAAVSPTIQYRLSHKFGIRGGYEYQRWPSFTGNRGKHGVTPNGLSLGVSYRLR